METAMQIIITNCAEESQHANWHIVRTWKLEGIAWTWWKGGRVAGGWVSTNIQKKNARTTQNLMTNRKTRDQKKKKTKKTLDTIVWKAAIAVCRFSTQMLLVFPSQKALSVDMVQRIPISWILYKRMGFPILDCCRYVCCIGFLSSVALRFPFVRCCTSVTSEAMFVCHGMRYSCVSHTDLEDLEKDQAICRNAV